MKKPEQKLEKKIHNKQPKVRTLLKDAVKMKPQEKDLSAMSMQNRMMKGMPPDMKKFYLEFKKNNPGRENEYYKAFVKMKKKENQKRLKEEKDEKTLASQSAKSTQADSFLLRLN